ncbi:outer membrane protein assembly factor [Seongchinamella unica]|uniref:Translocation and assembly module subunit TamA n=1 Tax=Seongchinamella unica TaxID=2547392 RepID=A0A4R5LS25_9GAMM|nr:autotransporter assembly complex family protein [Seongchinamella unica]TDG13682.1 outer membrane protein assembly factor [Seongchinamella unica]
MLIVLAALCALPARAQLLAVTLDGLDGELRENALAWLGDPPNTPQARTNYLYSARRKVEQSLQALGYYRADVDLNLKRAPDTWTLSITVEPGEPVVYGNVDVRISGDADTDPTFTKLLQQSPLKPGEVLNHAVYEKFRRSISNLGQRRGYFDGVFSEARIAVEPVSGLADVSLHYESGSRFVFGPLSYDQDIVKPGLLEPLLQTPVGEPYEQQKLQETQARLQRTGYFSTVILRPQANAATDGQVPLTLDLFPAKRHSINVGVGFSTDTQERVSLTWRTPRINRHGHSQESRLQYSRINPSGRVTYNIPLSDPLNDVLQLTARVEDNEFGDLDSIQQELGTRREIKRGEWVRSYSLRALNESWKAQGLDRENDYLLPGFSLSQRVHRGALVNPTGGFSQWYRVELGSQELGSDVDLLRLTADYGFIHTLAERHRLVFRGDIGAVFLDAGERDQLAPSLNFFAGGNQSIRGYSYQSIGNEATFIADDGEEVTLVIGGDRLLIGSAEYQYSFNKNWRGALFIDAGDAFDEGQFEASVGAGFGVHYVTPIGAIRLDLANPVTDDNPSWRFHLSIGAEF